jgi:hypothetical protein
MNAECAEVNVVEQASKAEETLEILALSFDDLDLVGGGAMIGALG